MRVRMIVTDFHCIFFSFKISYFVFNRRNKLIQVWNNMRE